MRTMILAGTILSMVACATVSRAPHDGAKAGVLAPSATTSTAPPPARPAEVGPARLVLSMPAPAWECMSRDEVQMQDATAAWEHLDTDTFLVVERLHVDDETDAGIVAVMQATKCEAALPCTTDLLVDDPGHGWAQFHFVITDAEIGIRRGVFRVYALHTPGEFAVVRSMWSIEHDAALEPQVLRALDAARVDAAPTAAAAEEYRCE